MIRGNHYVLVDVERETATVIGHLLQPGDSGNFAVFCTADRAVAEGWIHDLARSRLPETGEPNVVLRHDAPELFAQNPGTPDATIWIAVARLAGFLPPRNVRAA